LKSLKNPTEYQKGQMNGEENRICFRTSRSGMALILVIVVLVVLTAIVYRISSSISQWKHRQQYIIDYQTARYGCESGLKYALTTISQLTPAYVSRPNEPDFSDLFNMSDKEYKLMMEDWARQLGTEIDANNLNKSDYDSKFMDFSSLFKTGDANNPGGTDSNQLIDFNTFSGWNEANVPQEPNKLVVRGPYGPPWPFVVEPVEIEFGNARVKIEIIDENAKLPLCWGIASDPNMTREGKAAIMTFCEWMQMEPNKIEPLLAQLNAIKEIKPFSMNLKPVVTATQQIIPSGSTGEQIIDTPRRRTSRRARERQRTRIIQDTRPDIGHTMDFAKLMHSPMIDLEELAKPVNGDENRSESALKYISLWGTTQVNVNTAPRQVLEAAFTFGGDAKEIADEIIKLRKEKPFSDIDDIKKRLFDKSASIEKAKNFITTQSDFFTIRATATSGVAKVSASAGIKKEKGGSTQKIGIIIE